MQANAEMEVDDQDMVGLQSLDPTREWQPFFEELKKKIENLAEVDDNTLNQWVLSVLPFCMKDEFNYLLVHVFINRFVYEDPAAGFYLRRVLTQLSEIAAQADPERIPLLNAALMHTPNANNSSEDVQDVLVPVLKVIEKVHTPNDIIKLYRAYKKPVPPHVNLLQSQRFIDNLIIDLYDQKSSRNRTERKEKVFLLAYMASYSPNHSKEENEKSLNETIKLLELAETLLDECGQNKQKIRELVRVFGCPTAVMGVLRWIRTSIRAGDWYTDISMGRVPEVFKILEEISIRFPLMHEHVLVIYGENIEDPVVSDDPEEKKGTRIYEEMEVRRKFVDRLLHLVKCNCVMPVIVYVEGLKGVVDESLIVHFVLNFLSMVEFPIPKPVAMHLIRIMLSVSIDLLIYPQADEMANKDSLAAATAGRDSIVTLLQFVTNPLNGEYTDDDRQLANDFKEHWEAAGGPTAAV
ncbi:TH1 protein-domain-containing protein [Cladochytrium replicatum]|nr:TH1 protein-domain-containing protein [Cladochytrium replicatum]